MSDKALKTAPKIEAPSKKVASAPRAYKPRPKKHKGHH